MSKTELVLHRIALAALAFGVLAALTARVMPITLTAHRFMLTDGLDGRRAWAMTDEHGNIVLAVYGTDQQLMFELVAPARAGTPVLLRSPDGSTRSLMPTNP